MTENEIAREKVDAAYRVHTTFGPGLYEIVYEVTMEYELKKRRLKVERQQAIPIEYESIRFDEGSGPI